jgi:hypothetical protein
LSSTHCNEIPFVNRRKTRDWRRRKYGVAGVSECSLNFHIHFQ